MHYWDPAYRCFTFNTTDLSPLLEEYGQLLGYDPHVNKVYNPGEVTDGRKIVHRFLQIEHTRTPGKDKGNIWVFPIDRLMGFAQGRFATPEGQMAFALAVYGAVLFPCAGGYVEKNVIKLVHLVKYGTNPIPAILCETIRSLNHCCIQGEGSFRGCSQLLGLWLVSHLKYPKGIGAPIIIFEDHTRMLRDPIQNFKMARMQSNVPAVDVWRQFLEELEPKETFDRATWYKPKGLLYRCGNYNWVPLVGPWGGTDQAPTMFLRQEAGNLCTPVTHGLWEFEFAHGDEKGKCLSHQVVEAWKRTHIMEHGRLTVDSEGKNRYVQWLRGRKKTITQYGSFTSTKRKETISCENENSSLEIPSNEINEVVDTLIEEKVETRQNSWKEKYSRYKNKCKKLKRKVQGEREAREAEKGQFDMLKKKFLKLQKKMKKRKENDLAKHSRTQVELQEVQEQIRKLNEELASWKEDAYQLQLQMHADREEQRRIEAEKDGLIEQMNEMFEVNQQQVEGITTLKEQNDYFHSMLEEVQQEQASTKFKVRLMMSRLMTLSDWAEVYERRLQNLSSNPVLEMPELTKIWAFLKNLKSDLQELQKRLNAVQVGGAFVVEISVIQLD
ncbi:uncharacterized protein LOC120012251 [Tripterygium wilfordii]|uniref:uncharacterized protein LOC120012251 n=1 Tax=Tripterygium wilfordii TaxID=458696 RepID=UPI0018F7E6BE|nr:uncharacterized protein LOC120012251 [Tripterygium wilfordii]